MNRVLAAVLPAMALLVLPNFPRLAAAGADDSRRATRESRASAPASAASKYPDAARCFFVYAALNEAGQKHSRPDLERYALQRLMWFRGFNEALIADPVWKEQFEATLKENKRQAELLASKLSAAAQTNSVRDYDAAVMEGDACDRRLGLYPRPR